MSEDSDGGDSIAKMYARISRTFLDLSAQFSLLAAAHAENSADPVEPVHQLSDLDKIDVVPIQIHKSAAPVQLIRDTVAALCGISISEIQSDSRERRIVQPRQIICFLSRKWTSSSYSQIAKLVGNMHHTSIMSGGRKIDKILAQKDKDYTQIAMTIAMTMEKLSVQVPKVPKTAAGSSAAHSSALLISDAVANVGGLSPELMRSKSVNPDIVLVKQVASHLMKQWTGATNEHIGKILMIDGAMAVKAGQQRISRILEKGEGEDYKIVTNIIKRAAEEVLPQGPSLP